jgi:hypothetical protein
MKFRRRRHAMLGRYTSPLVIANLLDSTIDLGYKLVHSNVRISATLQVHSAQKAVILSTVLSAES